MYLNMLITILIVFKSYLNIIRYSKHNLFFIFYFINHYIILIMNILRFPKSLIMGKNNYIESGVKILENVIIGNNNKIYAK